MQGSQITQKYLKKLITLINFICTSVNRSEVGSNLREFFFKMHLRNPCSELSRTVRSKKSAVSSQ